MIGQQLVADIVEVTHQRHVIAQHRQPVADDRHGRRRLVAVHRDAHDFRAGARQLHDLLDGRINIGGIGIGHGLHDNGGTTAHHHAANIDTN